MKSSPQQSKAAVALQWWAGLKPAERAQTGQQRAALARMRRAATPLEVMQEPEALRLIARLPHSADRVAALAGILAFVGETVDRRVAQAVGRTSLDSDAPRPVLSEGRFRRLLQVPHDEIMEPMRRVVRLADGKVNVLDLAHSVLYWGDRVKRHWIFDYYGVAASIRSDPGASL